MNADRLPAENLARRFHETYERLAPQFGYETRKDSAVPWSEVPERNRALMVAVAAEIRAQLHEDVASRLLTVAAWHDPSELIPSDDITATDKAIAGAFREEAAAWGAAGGSSPAVRGSCASGPGFGVDRLGQVRHEFAGSRFAP